MTDYTLRAPSRHTRAKAEATIRSLRVMHREAGGTSRLVRKGDSYTLTLSGAAGSNARQAASAMERLASVKTGMDRLEEILEMMGPA